ncbi:hypothetical protein LTR37_016917 [Vermiconidia calcicola]|uniref:Uncharacterized protein n=1 Tax=Vermiconidia calcicola TaxID=1690605 RepID=A0ACC3MLH4_9PEZI|nr:hypothetical protein LTR37_016917 [Vermiconidia calcicola]
MGRRPNPLVVEFFERGEKLGDNSNRYQHTCKRCGELFPKGRIESLTSHLLRRCPNVTQEDRQWVFQQLQHDPEKPNGKSLGFPASIRRDNPLTENSMPGLQQQSALDTLAEVSRHHLDYSSHRRPSDLLREQSARKTDDLTAEQSFIAQLRELTGGHAPTTLSDSNALYLYATNSAQPPATQTTDVHMPTSNALTSSPLVQTASAANQQLEAVQVHGTYLGQNSALLDPGLNDVTEQLIQSNGNIHREDDTTSWMTGQQTFGTLSLALDPSPGFGFLQNPTKKGRRHFNDTRRKEVQEIRKRGACIRCRMLKKPCSGKTPYDTCKNVDNARLWRGTCVRTRVADEFTLWSTRLFYSRASVQVPAAIHGLQQQPLPGRIEVRFFGKSELCMSFAAKTYSKSGAPLDPSLRQEKLSDDEEIWLLDEGEGISDKLELYANQVGALCMDEEHSHVLRDTLQRAQMLARAEEAEQAAKVTDAQDQQLARSYYNPQRQLVKNVLELWVQTKLLTSADEQTLQLRNNPCKASRLQPEQVDWTAEAQDYKTRDIPVSSPSHRLIHAQLMAALEARCNKLSKTVMNELERRLLQRQQVSRFATFIAAVVLLNCVERMTGLYRAFDNVDTKYDLSEGVQGSSKDDAMKQDSKAQASVTAFPNRETACGSVSYRTTDHINFWPLDTPPSQLWQQGKNFAELLAMLLRMRALPPKTGQRTDGTLAVIQDYSIPVHPNRRPVAEQMDEHTKMAAAWLDPLNLEISELMERRDAELPNPTAGVEEWDMRFVSKLLLPENMR